MKKVVVVFLVVVLMMLNFSVPVWAQAYLSKDYCDVTLDGHTLIFSLFNPTDQKIRHVYQTAQHIDYYIFGQNYFHHYAKDKTFMSAITYIEVDPHSSVVLDRFSLTSPGTYYVYVDFLVCKPRLYAVTIDEGGGSLREEIPSLFAIEMDTTGIYTRIGETVSVTVSVVSRVPLGGDGYIDIEFSPSPVLTVFYEDGHVDIETFTGTTVRLDDKRFILFEKQVKVKDPIKSLYVLLDGISFFIGGKGNTQYMEEMPPIGAPIYTVISEKEPIVTDVPHWAQEDVFKMYDLYILPRSVFVNMSGSITREEIIMGLASILDIPASSFSHTFIDIRRYMWGSYLSGMQWYHLLLGFPDGTVRGDKFITRAEMAALLARVLPPKPGDISFSDVNPDDWYSEYIKQIAGYDLLKGWDGKFYPHRTLTKAEAVVILYRMLRMLQ